MDLLPQNIIQKWGIASLPEPEQAEVIERMGRMIYQAVLVKSLSILSEKEELELDSILDVDTTTPEDVMSFLQKKIPDFEKLVTKERKNLREDLLLQAY